LISLQLSHIAVKLLKKEARLCQSVLVIAKRQIEIFRIAWVRGEKRKITVGIGATAIYAEIFLRFLLAVDKDEVTVFTRFDNTITVVIGVTKGT
jgi:hypothetical protein